MSRTTFKTKFTQNAEFVGDIHYFGFDRRGLWQHHADMRSQIEEMFAAYYGEDYEGGYGDDSEDDQGEEYGDGNEEDADFSSERHYQNVELE